MDPHEPNECSLCGKADEPMRKRHMVYGNPGMGGINHHATGPEYLCPRCHRREHIKTVIGFSVMAIGAVTVVILLW